MIVGYATTIKERRMNRFFTDKTSGMNLMNEFQYHAAGIIEADYTEDGKGNPSGKDYVVAYISPWGDVQREWRSVDEIDVYYPDEANFELLKWTIEGQGIENGDR